MPVNEQELLALIRLNAFACLRSGLVLRLIEFYGSAAEVLRRTSAEASQRVSSRARDRAPAKDPYVAVGTTPLFSDCTDACIDLDVANRSLAVVTVSHGV